MTNKRCTNCAWFCHADGRCYAHQIEWEGFARDHKYELRKGFDMSYPVRKPDEVFCMLWTFDGLEDWEREEQPALMTMETIA